MYHRITKYYSIEYYNIKYIVSFLLLILFPYTAHVDRKECSTVAKIQAYAQQLHHQSHANLMNFNATMVNASKRNGCAMDSLIARKRRMNLWTDAVSISGRPILNKEYKDVFFSCFLLRCQIRINVVFLDRWLIHRKSVRTYYLAKMTRFLICRWHF